MIENSKLTIQKPTLRELALLFFKLGATAFGGPAAHISMMQEEVVRRRQWLSQEEFLDLMGATNLIPGPNSTEMAIHIGFKMGHWRGLFLAGGLFILPAFLIVWSLAWVYTRFGTLPAMQNVFEGLQPVILAIIVQAVWSLSKTAVKNKILAVFALVAVALFMFGIDEILILLMISFGYLILNLKINPRLTTWILLIPALLALLPTRVWAEVSHATRVPLENIFLYFVKVGSVLFGSGYVLIAFLQSDLVDQYQWLSQKELLDAVAVGQFTPGPVFTTATFIGYLIGGHAGAIGATVGIFAPAFFFVALSAPFIPHLRKSKPMGLLLDGLNVASLSLMVGASLFIAKSSLQSAFGVIIFLVSLTLMMKFKLNSVWLILGAGILGFFGLSG